MKKAPFLIFAIVMSLVIGGIISFIQGPRFAQAVKGVLARYVPKDLGIAGDFEGLEVKLFPPGLSIINPRVRLLERNMTGLPPGSTVDARRIDLEFRPVQIFSGNIRVHEVTVVGGDVKLLLGDLEGEKKAKKKGFRPDFRWDELLQVHAEAISLRETRLRIEATRPALSAEFVAESVRVAQWSGQGGLGYELDVALTGISGSFLKGLPLPPKLDRASALAHVNASGLRIDSIQVSAAGAEAGGAGMLTGNLLEPKNLAFEGELKARGDLGRLMPILVPDERKRPAASGEISFAGKVRGNPARVEETLRVEGAVTGKRLRFREWSADSLSSDLAWAASPSGGELSVTRATIASREAPRAGLSPGQGGKVSVGAFKLGFAGGAPVAPQSVTLNLERAHLHWLAAPVVKNVFGLDFRATGPVTLSYRPAAAGRPWELESRLGLDVEGFRLDNQKLTERKPLKTILDIPRIRLEGGAIVDAHSLRPSNLKVSSGQTSFLGAGRIDFKEGFDLSFNGPVNLEDVRQIAEIDIRGKGQLAVRVHGPGSAVAIDFDTDLKEAEYIKLKLGDVTGRITWDDDRNRVLFTRMSTRLGGSTAQADGVVDVSPGKDTIDLGIRIPQGSLEDLLPVFGRMTERLGWFPRALTGSARGDVHVWGGIRTEDLVVDANVAGTDWEYWGERFGTVELAGGFSKGTFHAKDFTATKRNGRVLARVSLSPDGLIDWGLHTEAFGVGDFDHLARLDVPMRGRVVIESAGKGKMGAIKSSTTVRVEDLAVRGSQMPESYLLVRSENGKAEVTGSALGGQGTLEASYDFTAGGQSSLKARLSHLDFSPALLLLNPSLIQDRALAGRISGSVALAFRSGAIERANGSMELSEYLLAKSGTRFTLARPASLKVSEGSFDLDGLALRGNQGEALLSLRSRGGGLDGTVSGGLDVAIAEFFTPAVSDAEGVSDLDFAIGGSIKEPVVSGRASFDEVLVRVPYLETPFENASGTFQLRQNQLAIQNVRADLAGGRVTAEGEIQLFADRYPRIAIKAGLAGNKLKVPPFQFVKVDGGLDLRGEKPPYLVEGSVGIDSALSTEKVLSAARGGGGLKALQYTPPPSSSRSGGYPLFKLNIGVVAEDGVVVQNDLFDIEAKGRLTVVNTPEAPRLLGNAEVISGKLLFKDRPFQIQSGTATFDNPAVLNPVFSLAASTDISGTKVQMYVSGRKDSLKVELSSNPVMPESEILSLLALGVTSGDARRFSAADRSVLEQGEAASLLLHSLDFNREVQSKTGLQIQLDEAIAPQQQGQSIFKPQSAAESIAQPKIVIKRQIGKRFDLSYGTTVGTSSSSTAQEVNAEYHFTNGFSALGVWNNYQSVDTVERKSFGLDLKFQSRFK